MPDHPHHKHELGDATQSVELHNVSCGDDIQYLSKLRRTGLQKFRLLEMAVPFHKPRQA